MSKFVYTQRFFDELARRIGRCCKMRAEEIAQITPRLDRHIKLIELWGVMREIANWLSGQGVLRFVSIYDDPIRRAPFQVTIIRIADDLIEMAAWLTGQNGHAVRLGAPFPANAYERHLLIELFYAFYRRLADGVGFAEVFTAGLTADPHATAQTILYSPNPRWRVEAYQQFADRISVAALETLDDLARALRGAEQVAFIVFMEARLEIQDGFIDGAVIRRMAAEFFAIKSARRPIWFSPLPLKYVLREGRRPFPLPLLC